MSVESAPLLVSLGVIAVLAGLIDSLAGGGGLITIPALLLANVPPVSVLATNKVQAVSGTFTATCLLLRRGSLSLRTGWPQFIAALCGAVVGTIAIQRVGTQSLDVVVPIVLLVISLYTLFAPPMSNIEGKPRIDEATYRTFVIPIIGFYDGMFGPGTGSFFAMSGVALRGLDLFRATANAKLLNLATNAASCAIFLFSGKIVWSIAIVMIIGQMLGSSLGVYLLTRGAVRWIRPAIVVVCFAMLARYGIQKHFIHW